MVAYVARPATARGPLPAVSRKFGREYNEWWTSVDGILVMQGGQTRS
jgi:hypothetical protein